MPNIHKESQIIVYYSINFIISHLRNIRDLHNLIRYNILLHKIEKSNNCYFALYINTCVVS